jgi:hypothetical protein
MSIKYLLYDIKANYFYGTKTSLFLVNIFAERQVMGFDSEQQFI